MTKIKYTFLDEEVRKELIKPDLIICECGSTHVKTSKSSHLRSQKHLKYMADKAPPAAPTQAPEKEQAETLDKPIDLGQLLSFKVPHGLRKLTITIEL